MTTDSSHSQSPHSQHSGSQSPFYRAAWITYLIIAIAGLIGWGQYHGDISLSLFIDTETWWLDISLGIGSGALLAAAWRIGRAWIPAMQDVEAWMGKAMGPLTGSEIIALALISGFSEELLFRGALQSAFGWHWSLGIFALLHTGPGRSFLYWTLFALLAGGAFSWLTLLRGNILPAIVAHVVVNGINMSLLMRDSEIFESSHHQ